MTAALLLAAALAAAAPRGGPRVEVRRVLERELEIFSRYDAAIADEVYAPDVIWQNPFGVRLHGRDALRRFLGRVVDSPGFRAAKPTKPNVITDITLLARDVASAWSEESSHGQRNRSGEPIGDRRSHILYVLKRTTSGWRITDELIMDER